MPPDKPVSQRPLFGRMGGTVRKEGDLLAPLALEWSAVTGDEDDLYRDPRKDRFIHGAADAPKRRPK